MHLGDSKSYTNMRSGTVFRHDRWCCAKIPSFRARNQPVAQLCQVSRLAYYTNVDLADMNSAYGALACSGPVAQRL